jgi:fatty-acyl-CoA synthase
VQPSTYQALLESLALEQKANEVCQEFVDGDAAEFRSYHRVLELAQARGAGLASLGLKLGDRVGILVNDPGSFLPLLHGCLLHGFVAVPLYAPPLFGSSAVHKATLESIAETAEMQLLVVDDGANSRLPMAFSRVVEAKELAASGPAPERVAPDDLAFLQFTSGSEGAPKGVRITHRALMANAHAIMIDGLRATDQDHGVSWLPLFHDMGLVGFGLAPLLTRTPVTFIPTSRFVRNPAIWLKTLADRRATITFAPNFAYGLVARRANPTGLDLGSVRMWGCGAEPVSNATLESFERRFAECGITLGQVSPCYGLAEATLAVTFTPPSSGRIVDTIDADAWERRGVAEPVSGGRALTYVSCGSALGEQRVSVVGDMGQELPERTRGEIVVESPSLGDGYVGSSTGPTPFRDGRLFSGDIGYLSNGQLFVTGRRKDTVIVNGRNYDPHVIEASATSVEGVRLAAAVNVAGAEGDLLVVLVEQSGKEAARTGEAVRARIAAELGLAARVVCLAPGRLPRTTSGKLKRAAARALCTSSEGMGSVTDFG